MSKHSRLWSLVGFIGGASLVLAISATPSSSEAASVTSPVSSLSIPLSSAVANSSTSWVTLPMGRPSNFNLFWQLFSFTATSSRWKLVTPPGVADNGGLVIGEGASANELLVAFGSSQALLFSPLALTSTAGTSWAPGALGQAVDTHPDAIALGSNDRAYALVGSEAHQEVLGQGSGLTTWKTFVTRHVLGASAAGKSCGIASLQAVAAQSENSLLVGATCSHLGTVGLFSGSGASWRLVSVALPKSLANDDFGVVRLSGTAALVSVTSRTAVGLAALWRSPGNSSWSMSAPLWLDRGARLIASGSKPAGGLFVVMSTDDQLRAAVIDAGAGQWTMFSHLPKGTATLAYEPDGQLDAFSVSVKTLTVFRYQSRKGSWANVQTIVVPIVFGSSD